MSFLAAPNLQGIPDGSACNTGDTGDVGSTPGSGRSPGEGNGNPLQYSCLKNPHGQRSLAGYSPWVPKESDTTERLNMQSPSLVISVCIPLFFSAASPFSLPVAFLPEKESQGKKGNAHGEEG